MKSKTYYHLILDRSGSMQDVIDTTISSFNEQLQAIHSLQSRFPEQMVYFGLTQFNDHVQHTCFTQPIERVKPLTKNSYVPDGTTALYDAIGSSVLLLKEKVQTEVAKDEATVVVIILTDGHENASRHFSYSGIASLIKELEQGGNWTFSYLGATPDAVEIASTLNIKKQNSFAFDKQNLNYTMGFMSSSLKSHLAMKEKGKNPPDL